MKKTYKQITILSLLYVCTLSHLMATQQGAAQRITVFDKQNFTFKLEGMFIETLNKGFKWAEGPVWIDEKQILLFSDIPNNQIIQYNAKTKATSIFLQNSGYTKFLSPSYKGGSNGLLINNKNELIVFQHGDRRIAKLSLNDARSAAKYTTVADKYNGKRFNSPNDGFFAQTGDLYFTDPPYGLPGKIKDARKEIDFQGIYLLKADGKITLQDDSVNYPNGIIVSKDQSAVFVSVSDPQRPRWLRYEIGENGILSNKQLVLALSADATKGLPDGMAVHSNGQIFATGPDGLRVFSSKGKLLALIRFDEKLTNCVFNSNESILYITSPTSLLALHLKAL